MILRICIILTFLFAVGSFNAQQSVWERMSCSGCSGVDFSDVDFANQDTGYAVGYPFLLRTTDGGRLWVKSEPRGLNGMNIHAVSFPTGRVGYMGGTDLLKTTDAGQTWNHLHKINSSDGEPSYIIEMDFSSELFGILIGSSGFIYFKTVDGGLTLERSLGSCTYCTSIKVVDDSTAYIGGWVSSAIGVGATLFKMEGLRWGEIPNWPRASMGLTLLTIEAIPPHHIWVGGHRQRNLGGLYSRHLVYTLDGGSSTWQEPETILPHPINAIAFADALHGFVGDDHGDIYMTSDGGRTWSLDYDGNQISPINDISISGNTIVAVGNYSLILRRSMPVSVQEANTSPPLRLYPNPTTGRVRVDIGEAEAAVITVVDVMGRTQEVAMVSNNELDVSMLTTGTYVVVVRHGTRMRTELLMKAGE